jgi:hypothetical protein
VVRCPISSANAQDDRTNHSLRRNSRGAHQHLNPVGSPNLAPMSSAWWLGWSCNAGPGADGPDLEGVVHDFRPFRKNVNANVFEVHTVKLHVDENLLLGNGSRSHIDPVCWLAP